VILIVSTLSALVVIATQAIKQAQVIFGKITPESDNLTFDELWLKKPQQVKSSSSQIWPPWSL